MSHEPQSSLGDKAFNILKKTFGYEIELYDYLRARLDAQYAIAMSEEATTGKNEEDEDEDTG